ncbi:MAG: transposase [Lachnospiraceae bacterium]|nr:transposase [Lachnospiraceae bacterium]
MIIKQKKKKSTAEIVNRKLRKWRKDKRIRRDHKASVFAMIFHDRERALQLYNAISGRDYTDSKKIDIVTLENAVYLNVKNDVSILVDERLYMVEHQSTVNPNMPLRDLFYVARQYEGIVGKAEIYSSKAIRVPLPFFVTLYNGKASQPERKLLRLSELYYPKMEGAVPDLELKVLQLNINPGYNEELKEACKPLRDYMIYVEKIRCYEKIMSLEEAARKAIDECIEEDVLADFFVKQKKEALEMILYDVDIDEYDKVKYRDGFEDGKAEAQSVIFYNMLEDGMEPKRAQQLAGLDDATAERLVREKNQYMDK